MVRPDRSVLHVLPHAGGGGDTYVDVLRTMPGYRFTRIHLASSRKSDPRELAHGFVEVARALPAHDLMHVHGEVASGLLLPLLAARPSVVTLHGLHLLRRMTGLRRHVAALNLRAIVRAADWTICVSTAEGDALNAVVGTGHRTVVVRNGARIPLRTSTEERARVREEFGLAHSDVVGIWVGSLDERRDPVAVVHAAEHASVPFLMVGDGPLRAETERAATTRVRVLGHREDVPRLLAAADFFVLMSHREGFSFAILEAMAHGLPAVVADVAENVEAIGESGLAVPYGDEEALVAAFRRLAKNENELVSLGERALRRVAMRFTAEDMISRTRAVYEGVLGGRH
jgi:glycosyltransferase involved in cell wall biosynthesis